MAHGERNKAHNHHRSSERRFDKFITHIDNKPIGVRRLICATEGCGQQGEILDRTPNGLVPKVIEERFTKKGWSVGANEKHDYCPRCVESQRVARRQARFKPLQAVVVPITSPMPPAPQQEIAMSTATLSTAPPPDQMDREHRRTIFAKLQDVYVDERQGYSTPWTDQAVAKDLGCPIAWVITIREENFGPAADNSEIRAMLQRVEEGALAARGILDEAKKLRTECSVIVERINALSKQATDVGKSLEGLLATADRIKRSVQA